VQSVLDSLDAFGGIYVAMFLFAMLSGVFPVANSEAAVIALGATSNYGWPKLLVIVLIVALGQVVTHSILFHMARGLAKVGAKKRPWLDARLAKARALGEKWKASEVLLMILGATIGFPPQILIAILAGAIGIRFRVFLTIDVLGRIARFATLAAVARLAANA
jgi:membrane protein YqaA with SNARE-associated domain